MKHKINKTFKMACLVLTGVTLSSCASSPDKTTTHKTTPKTVTPITSASKTISTTALNFSETTANKPKPGEAISDALDQTEPARTKSERYPARDRVISGKNLTAQKTKPKGTGAYTLNFNDADLAEVAKTILSDSLGLNYVLSPDVKGKVTLQTTQAISKEELLPTLEMVLRMNNAALVKDSGIYHIEPVANALYSSDLSIGGKMVGYQTKVIPVRNVSAEEMSKLLKPLVLDKTILQVDNERNILVASGTGDEMQRVLEMVNAFDVDMMRGRSFALFSLAHVDPETVIKELEAVFNAKSGDKDGGFFRFIPIERLNAILAVTHQARYLDDIESWVFRLDKANTASEGNANVYRVQHVDAVELADTLNEIFTGAKKKSKKEASVVPGQEATELSSNDNSASTPPEPKPAASTNRSSDLNSSKGDEDSTGLSSLSNVRIIADEPNNALVIVATAAEYERIIPIIKQLDVMPLQVLIDATIVEVDLKNDLEYGMQWAYNNGNFNSLLSNGGGVGALGLASSGFSLFYSGGSIKAVLKALADKSTINVIASPSLMVLNNQEASLNVGDKVPIATSQATNTSSATTTPSLLPGISPTTSAFVTNSIQMLDTGITLKIKPHVNAGGLVLMKIDQEANQAVKTTTSDLNSPTIQQRKIHSSVAIKSGETIVLGGLIREDNTNGVVGLPILSELPVVGPLFGTVTRNKKKTELVVLITPRVVENEKNARDVTEEFKRKLTGVYDKLPNN
jgi:general secretion pathway protein D